ncbi:AlpA family phage regulatory protein [Altererythrobacter xixiisoli]|uniref:AlpA family phage regulatory protein n=1 Tax=Croceibacterium xixiisoli TaxID=1476466 RepID=A0A6I4TYQ7_9SPHN|nr:AlpA family phage regulatory protein [Croceibacterium xixiisoli]MXP00431.1 AlpA family phage regulatory protein [Croceibacterium xixiisoli]
MPEYPARTGRFLTLRDIVKETSLSRATIYRMIARGEFPAGTRISPRRVTWRSETIEAWKSERYPIPQV